jgi:multiple sugar transport system ATP-binding protein
VTQRFNRTIAIENISFEVPDGEFWVLVGPSGCGKSTLLRAIAGLEPINEGQLYIGEVLMNTVPARQRDVAMVFQNYALYPHMSVAENLAFGLRMRGANTQTIRDRVETVARSLNIAHLLERKPRQLSGGQQQRVALGRAIIRQPQVFLLDEPLSNLDAQLRDGTRAELKQLHQQLGITTLYVTHDQVEAMTLANCLVVLNQGRIQQIGPPQDLYAHPANRMVATFLGSPPMNIFPAVYTGSGLKIAEQTLACPQAVQSLLHKGQPVDLGIRPHQLQVVPLENCQLRVTVTTVEPLGQTTLLRTHLAEGLTLTLEVASTLQAQPGDRLSLALSIEDLFVFNANTGQRLSTHSNLL